MTASVTPSPPSRARPLDRLASAIMLLPAGIAIAVFVLVPAVLSLVGSLFRIPLAGGAWSFVGLDNFVRVLTDPAVLQAIRNTLVYSALTIIPSLLLGLALALLTNAAGRVRPLVRTLLFLPMTANLVAISVVFSWIFSFPGGFVNQLIGVFGAEPVNWLGDTATALPVVALVGVWRTASLTMLIFFAGLATIPTSIDEAAQAEGIRGLRKLVLVTLPMIRPNAVFACVLAILGSVQVFDTINVMTRGGPLGSTETVLTMVWRIGFGYFDLGAASALALMLLVLLIGVGLLQRRTLSGWER